MTKYLITGVSGFVGRHLLDFLDSLDSPVEILGLDRNSDFQFKPKHVFWRFEALDMESQDALTSEITNFKPDRIIHLAAQSSVQESWNDPFQCISSNTTILLNLLDCIRKQINSCRILFVGSSEVYEYKEVALRESSLLNPRNPYALSRLLQENICKFYTEYFSLDIVSTRSFLHIGPGQQSRFAIASFVSQLAEAEKSGMRKTILKTGNVDLQRDISDVRDVVRAYFLLLEKGKTGEIYNICRGESVLLQDVIKKIARILNIEVTIQVEPALLRSTDAKKVLGNNEKLRNHTAWMPELSLEQTLRDMIAIAIP